MMGLHPDLIPLGLDGSPDANTKDEQVKDNCGQQSWDIESHIEALTATAQTEQRSTAC